MVEKLRGKKIQPKMNQNIDTIFSDKQQKKLTQSHNLGLIKKELQKARDAVLGASDIKTIDTCIKYINKTEERIKNVSKFLSENSKEDIHDFIQKIKEQKEDPLDGIQDIPDTIVRNAVVSTVLNNMNVRNYLTLLFSEEQYKKNEQVFEKIGRETYDNVLKKQINMFLNGIRSAREKNELTFENIQKWIKDAAEIKKREEKQINLETIFKNDEEFKKKLKKEIYYHIFNKTIEVDEDDDSFEENDTEVIEYKTISDFYNKYLNGTRQYLNTDYTDKLIKEFEEFLSDRSEDRQTPNIEKFVEMLKQEQSKFVETEEKKDEDKNEAPKIDFKEVVNSALFKDKKEEKQGGLLSDLAIALKLKAYDSFFGIITTALFCPVSFAITFSQVRIKKEGKGFAFDSKGILQDLAPMGLYEEKKDKK